MADRAIDFIFDYELFMVIAIGIPIALIVMQWRLIARTEGPLRASRPRPR